MKYGNFLRFFVNQRGIEVDKIKTKVILDLPAPTTKKQLQLI